MVCKSIGCNNLTESGHDFCASCRALSCCETDEKHRLATETQPTGLSLADLYPRYYKSVGELTEVDVYAVHMLFNVSDPSGAIHHASKKLLLSGVRTGNKSTYNDVREARDTLTRWLQLFPQERAT